MNVVQSIYTFDEKVLIYAEYDEILHEILDKVKKYYEVKARNKWGGFAFASGVEVLASVILGIMFFKHKEYISFALALVSLLLSGLLTLACAYRVKTLEQKFRQIKEFLESELSEIAVRDNEVRSLRLIDRRGFNNIIRVENNDDTFCYLFFDSEVYSKPCIMDEIYFKDNNNKVDLSIYDDYYTEVKKRIKLLQKSKTVHALDKASKNK